VCLTVSSGRYLGPVGQVPSVAVAGDVGLDLEPLDGLGDAEPGVVHLVRLRAAWSSGARSGMVVSAGPQTSSPMTCRSPRGNASRIRKPRGPPNSSAKQASLPQGSTHDVSSLGDHRRWPDPGSHRSGR